MNRKHSAIAGGIVSLLALLAAGLFLSLKYQPTFYKTALAQHVPLEVRREQAATAPGAVRAASGPRPADFEAFEQLFRQVDDASIQKLSQISWSAIAAQGPQAAAGKS